MSDVGIKIQARNECFINPTIPTRDEVRKSNYLRRQVQMSSEGFYSKLWKPYICIGHPLELDKAVEKPITTVDKKTVEIKPKLVSAEKMEDSESNNHNRNIQISQNSRKLTEKLEQLNRNMRDEIRKSELVNFNVRTGHSFFDLLQKEHDTKKASAEEALQQQRVRETTEIRPPTIEDEDESDMELPMSDEKDSLSRSSTMYKKRPNSRPFTPMYNNISSLTNRSHHPNNDDDISGRQSTQTNDASSDGVKQASLFRQLSALHWLLEAMTHDNVDSMARISLSWTMRNEDNGLTSAKNRKDIKTSWDKYVSKQDISILGPKSRSSAKSSTQSHKFLFGVAHKPKEKKNLELESDEANPLQVTKLLKTPESSSLSTRNRLSQSAGNIRRRRMIEKVRSVCEDIEKESDDYEYKKNLHLIRIGKRPMDDKQIMETSKLQLDEHISHRFQHMLTKHQDQTNQIIDERIVALRENVRNMSDYKMTICMNKYRDIQTRGAFHHMLKNFRGKNTYQNYFAALDRSRNKIFYTDWFLSLEDNLKEYVGNKRIEQIVEKIRQYGLNTVTKLTVNRLLTVLKYLSNWEIRHPDISASIKFVTDHIVSMPEEEYQVWFDKNFPSKGGQ